MHTILVPIFFLHWLGDFTFQGRWIAANKSKGVRVLFLHVLVYTAVMAAGLAFLAPFRPGALEFLGVTAAAHFAVDFVTSRLTSYFHARGLTYWFFNTIGFDQFLHAACLILAARTFLDGM